MRPEPEPEIRRPRAASRVDRRWLVVAVAIVIAALAAWRATLGMSLMDDGYYAAATVRLAQGARLFADEMFVQSLGFLAAVPFAKAWLWLFGTTGVVAALRVFYVAVATGAAMVIYRLLRPSFGRWASLAGAVAVFLAPVYNVLAVSYDTMAALGIALACVLIFAAVRDSSRWYAAAAGAAAAFASVSYPPLALVAITLLVTLAVRSRDRRLVGGMALGAAAVVVTFLVWLFATTSLAEIGIAYRFVIGTWLRASGPARGTRAVIGLDSLVRVLGGKWRLPLWAWFGPAAMISLGAAYCRLVAPRFERARGLALMVLPVALAIPVFANWSVYGRPTTSLRTLGGNYLIAFVLFAAAPMFASLWRVRSDRRDLVLMALPAGLLGYVVTLLASSAFIGSASPVVGLAPLAVAAIVWWAEEIADAAGTLAEFGGVAVLIFALLVLLFGSTLYDSAPVFLHHTISTGAYAGVTTTKQEAAKVAELERLAGRWVHPTTTVTIVSLPGAYLVTGGIPLTNVTWLDTGRLDDFTVAYLDRIGSWPDVVLVPLARLDRPDSVIKAAPFLSAVVQRYRLAERSTSTGLAVFTSRAVAPGQP